MEPGRAIHETALTECASHSAKHCCDSTANNHFQGGSQIEPPR